MPERGEEAFWELVERSEEGCWRWSGGTEKGYGYWWDGERVVRAHRQAWCYVRGRPPRGLLVNRCGERACPNPEHWEEGTRSRIARERVREGTMAAPFAAGEGNPRHLITEEVRAEARLLREAGSSYRSIAGELGVSLRTVQRILTGGG